MSDSTAKRVTVYDWVRLIAIVFVVLGHSDYLSMGTTYGGVEYLLTPEVSPMFYSRFFNFWWWFTDWIYSYHMPLFFMLSGAVFTLRPEPSISVTVKSKAKRLLLPYLVYGWLFMFPVKFLGNFYSKESLTHAMLGFLWGEDSGHLWFLMALFWCFIIFAIIKKVLQHFNINSNCAIIVICFFIYYTYALIPFEYFNLKLGLKHLVFFAIGYAFQKERQQIEKWSKSTAILIFVVLALIELFNKKLDFLDGLPAIIIGSFFVYSAARLIDIAIPNIAEHKWWSGFINSLIYVYIFHDPLNYLILRVCFERHWLESAAGCVAFLLCRTVGILVVSFILGQIVVLIKKTIKNKTR